MRAICSLPVPGKWSLTPVSPRIPSGNWTDARASCRRDIRRMGIRITRCSSPSTWLVCRCFTCWTLSFQLFWCSCYQVCLNILLQCFTNQKKISRRVLLARWFRWENDAVNFNFAWSNCVPVSCRPNHARNVNIGAAHCQVSSFYNVNGGPVGNIISGGVKHSLPLHLDPCPARMDEEVLHYARWDLTTQF